MSDPTTDGHPHPEIEADLSDFIEKALPAARHREIEEHLAGCAPCRTAHEELRGAVAALSGLHKMGAPQHFEREVEETIRRRSRGRFFGRKTFGDRVPLELIAVIVMAIGLAIFALLWSSQTGSLRYEEPAPEPRIDPRARDVVLQPGLPGATPPQADAAPPAQR
jgi:predicted anti-sigma-YlaC factor YlaD